MEGRKVKRCALLNFTTGEKAALDIMPRSVTMYVHWKVIISLPRILLKEPIKEFKEIPDLRQDVSTEFYVILMEPHARNHGGTFSTRFTFLHVPVHTYFLPRQRSF